MQRECLVCGMPAELPGLVLEDLPPRQSCIKCDEDLYQQSDGSCLSCDIAHQQETVAQALQLLDQALIHAWQGNYASILVVVGGGVIRREVLGQLHYYQHCGYLLESEEEQPHRGAIRVRIRRYR